MAQSVASDEAGISKCEAIIQVEGQNEKQTPDFEKPEDLPDLNAQDGSPLSANLDPFVSSAFKDHSLLPILSMVSSVMAGATYLPVSEILNL
ncbi:MFS siderophore transporter MirB-like protein [Penicillium odoratum]|uniref:MFS siderophore transporter MirB-like protein n=1 Tax=Penicillium odoratum TaxID=1167516 RepID=UPI002548C7DE|nr:MFS siderophore transporter MirB-like protein [Penicillium odoratum]KAJ5777134.1 MFS siderophore transporter MirB-like protein [Penicillium odoratum]